MSASSSTFNLYVKSWAGSTTHRSSWHFHSSHSYPTFQRIRELLRFILRCQVTLVLNEDLVDTVGNMLVDLTLHVVERLLVRDIVHYGDVVCAPVSLSILLTSSAESSPARLSMSMSASYSRCSSLSHTRTAADEFPARTHRHRLSFRFQPSALQHSSRPSFRRWTRGITMGKSTVLCACWISDTGSEELPTSFALSGWAMLGVDSQLAHQRFGR